MLQHDTLHRVVLQERTTTLIWGDSAYAQSILLQLLLPCIIESQQYGLIFDCRKLVIHVGHVWIAESRAISENFLRCDGLGFWGYYEQKHKEQINLTLTPFQNFDMSTLFEFPSLYSLNSRFAVKV